MRKTELTEQQIEKSLVQAEVSRSQGEIAHVLQNADEIEDAEKRLEHRLMLARRERWLDSALDKRP
jgi:uncharacterized protein YbaP (TraB family)